jgi:hypothetical protein
MNKRNLLSWLIRRYHKGAHLLLLLCPALRFGRARIMPKQRAPVESKAIPAVTPIKTPTPGRAQMLHVAGVLLHRYGYSLELPGGHLNEEVLTRVCRTIALLQCPK